MDRHFIVVALVAAVGLGGCAAGPTLRDNQLPDGGRYTVVITRSDTLNVQFVGTTVFTNVDHLVPLQHNIPEYLRDVIVDIARACPNCTYVPTNQRFALAAATYSSYGGIMNMGSGYASMRSDAPEERGAQWWAMREGVAELAERENLDFVIVLFETGNMDSINQTSVPLSGYGLRLRSELGFRRFYAFSSFGLHYYHRQTGLWRGGQAVMSKMLPREQIFEIEKDVEPDVETVAAFVDDIKSTFHEQNDLRRILCSFGMLPKPIEEPGISLTAKCASRHRR